MGSALLGKKKTPSQLQLLLICFFIIYMELSVNLHTCRRSKHGYASRSMLVQGNFVFTCVAMREMYMLVG